MTVNDLIAILKTHHGDTPVAFSIFSEWRVLNPEDIEVKELCAPRPDGWVHDARPDKPKQPYLVLP